MDLTKVNGTPLQFAPEFFRDELSDWINWGILPGDHLLRAILFNDLAAVVGLTGGSTLVRQTQRWLWNFAPVKAYGSPALVEAWERQGGRGRKVLQ